MRCLSCQTINPAGHRFCEACGIRLGLTCKHCGQPHGPSSRFCGNCGATIAGAARGLPDSEASRAWGEFKQATVLFADVVSSTELIASMDPEQAMGSLRPAVLRMCEVVERFGGTVVRTLGDGILALFGVPRALEGHAVLGCEAALSMQRAFRSDPQGMAIRVGLHSGQVASDPQDADGTRGGGVHGLTIHLASRVVALAPPGGICLTESCHALVSQVCEVEAMGPHALKGISGLTPLYRLQGVKPAARGQRFHLPAGGSFQGREHELALLRGAWLATAQGDGQVVGISAAPGTGKSRLSHEFARWCAGREVPVHEVRTQLYGHAMPLQPVLELMRGFFFGIGADDGAAVARERIATRLAALPAGAGDDAGLMQEFLGIAAAGAVPSALPPKARHDRLLAIAVALLKRSTGTPAVVLIEDLHWLDEASEEFVGVMAEAVSGTRTMLVLTYRPTFRAPWAGLANFRQLDLPELSAADTDALAGELLGPLALQRQDLEAVRRLVARRSAGNPFFAEELVRSLRESGVLRPGAPAGRGLDAVERALPDTVQAVISARLDRLGEPGKTLLQMCAIIGKDVPVAILTHVATPVVSEIEAGLEGLCRAELIMPQEPGGGQQFTFRHPLIQEVAYASQLKVRRGHLHAKVAEAMEIFYRAQPDEYAGLIAYHYEAAEQRARAAVHEGRAAQWVGSNNPALAIRHWHKVRDLLLHEPRSLETDRQRAIACSKIVFLGWREGLTLEAAKPYVSEAVELAEDADPRLIQLLLFVEGRMLQSGGGPADGYVERLRTALALHPEQTTHGRTATLNAALSQAYAWAGLLREALSANDVALAGVASIDAFDREFMGFSIEYWLLGMRARQLARLGRTAEAKACSARVLQAEPGTLDPVLLLMGHCSSVDVAASTRDAAMAMHHAGCAMAIAEKNGSPYMRVLGMNFVATAHAVALRFAEARRIYADAIALIRASSVAMELEAEVLASLAECHRRAGEVEQALAVAREAVLVARQRSIRLAECGALITMADALVVLRPDGWRAAARTLLDDARTLVERTGTVMYDDALTQADQALEATLQPSAV